MKFLYLLLALSLVLVQDVIAQEDQEQTHIKVEADVGNLQNDVHQNTGHLYEMIGAMKEENSLLVSRLDTVEEENSALRVELDDLKLLVSSLRGEVQDLSTNQRQEALEESTANTVFMATISAFSIIPFDPIVFDLAIVNPGGNYNPTNGVYTVPVNGIYQFVFQYRNTGDTISGAYLTVDNVRVAYIINSDADFADQGTNLVMTLSLTSGRRVWISPFSIDGMLGTDQNGIINSWFSGHLLYPL